MRLVRLVTCVASVVAGLTVAGCGGQSSLVPMASAPTATTSPSRVGQPERSPDATETRPTPPEVGATPGTKVNAGTPKRLAVECGTLVIGLAEEWTGTPRTDGEGWELSNGSEGLLVTGKAFYRVALTENFVNQIGKKVLGPDAQVDKLGKDRWMAYRISGSTPMWQLFASENGWVYLVHVSYRPAPGGSDADRHLIHDAVRKSTLEPSVECS